MNEVLDNTEFQPIGQEENLSSHYSSNQMTSDIQLTDSQVMKMSDTGTKDIDMSEMNANQDSVRINQPVLDKQSTSLQQKNEIEHELPSEHILELHHAQGGFGNNFYGVISSFAIAALMNYTLTCKYLCGLKRNS